MIIKDVKESIRKSGKNAGKPYYTVFMDGGAKYLCDDDLRNMIGKAVSYGTKVVGDTTWISNVQERHAQTSTSAKKEPAYESRASSFACSYAKDTVNEILRGIFQHMSPMDAQIIGKTMEELRPIVADNVMYYIEMYEEKMK